MTEHLNVVIPVYNEGENIACVFRELEAKVKTPLRILVVYDFEEDTTCPVVRGWMQSRDNIVLLKNEHGRGVLNALKTGFAHADAAVLVVMGDMSDDFSKIDEMYARSSEGYDVVCGSRYAKGGKQIGGPRLKGFLSRMAGISLHWLTGLPTHDVSNSFKMYSRRVLAEMSIQSDGGFEIGMEILVKAYFRGYTVTEVPSVWRDRTAGQSRFKLVQWLPKYLRWYLFALKCSARNLVVGGAPRIAGSSLGSSTPRTEPTRGVELGTRKDKISIRECGEPGLPRSSERRAGRDSEATAVR